MRVWRCSYGLVMTVLFGRNRKLQCEFDAVKQEITHRVHGSSVRRQFLTLFWWNIFIHDLFSFLKMKLSVDVFKQKLSSFYFLSTAECFCSTKMTNEIPPKKKNWRRTWWECVVVKRFFYVSRGLLAPVDCVACIVCIFSGYFSFLSRACKTSCSRAV